MIMKSDAGVEEAQDRVNNVVSRLVVLAGVAAALASANLLQGERPSQDQLDALVGELEAMCATLAPVATAGEAGPRVPTVEQPPVVAPPVEPVPPVPVDPVPVPVEVAPAADLPPQDPASDQPTPVVP